MKKFWGGLVLLLAGLGMAVLMVVCMTSNMVLLGSCLLILGIIAIVFGINLMKTAGRELKEQLAAEALTGEKTTRRKIAANVIVTVCILLAVGAAAVFISASVRAVDLNEYVSYTLERNEGNQDLEYLAEIDERVARCGPIARSLFYKYGDEVQARKDAQMQAIRDRAAEITAGIDALEECTEIRSQEHYIQLSSAIYALKLMGSDEFTYQVRELVTNYDQLQAHEEQLEAVRANYRHTCNECKGNGGFTCDNCGGGGRLSCSYCNGSGKKVVTWYSNGDWGEKSYTSYDCTSCNGRGKRNCGSCNSGKRDCSACDSGYYYIYEDALQAENPTEEAAG